jgi:hypothetical protein
MLSDPLPAAEGWRRVRHANAPTQQRGFRRRKR